MVEIGQAHASGIVQQILPIAVSWKPIATQVHIKIEIRVEGQSRASKSSWTLQGSHPQLGHEMRESIHTSAKPRPIWWTFKYR